MAFDISQQVKIVNPTANVDYYYGTYASIAEACASVPSEIRVKGKTVGILTDNGVVEYWWKSGIEDKDLVVKSGLTSKIIHVVDDNDIEDFWFDYKDGEGKIWDDMASRIKNLKTGDLFMWNSPNSRFYYVHMYPSDMGCELVPYCVYKILGPEDYKTNKIKLIGDLRINFDKSILDTKDAVAEVSSRIVKLLASREGEYDWDDDMTGKLDGVRVVVTKDASNQKGYTCKFILSYPLYFEVSEGEYKAVFGSDGFVDPGAIRVATPSSSGLMSSTDKSKLDNIPEGGSNLAHEWIGTALKVTSSNGTSTSLDLKGDPGDIDMVDTFDFSSLRVMGGQPEMLFAAGTPQDGLVPINWRQYADGGFDWNGTPSMLGQRYVDTSASQGGLYIAVPDGEYSLKWQKIS